MYEFPIASTLWALHPRYLDAIHRQTAACAVLPSIMSRLVSGFAGTARSAHPDAPVRRGSTLIVPVVGVLAPHGMYPGGTSYDLMADQVREAAADKAVTTIVLAIRSPGGTVWGCEEAGDAIYAARTVKPVIAVADPYCFSAAYWLATQASKFYVTTSGEVGSVGVRSGHTDLSGFEEKIGMKTTLIASSPDKIAGHPHAPLTAEDRAEIQSGVDAASRRFMIAISRGRSMPLLQVARVHGTGGTFSAPRALANGAIDGIATMRDVIGHHCSGHARLALMRRQAALAAMMADI